MSRLLRRDDRDNLQDELFYRRLLGRSAFSGQQAAHRVKPSLYEARLRHER
jgi:hypothetical protein